MVTEGQRLARVQVAGHHAIDAVAAPMAKDMATLTRQYWPFAGAALLFLRHAMQQRLVEAEPALVAITVATSRAAELAADPAGPVDVTRLSIIEQTAAASLAKVRPNILDQSIDLVKRGIVLGLAAGAVAKTVGQYFYKADPATGLIQSWPGTANMALQLSRGLMLNEATAGHFWGMKRVTIRENWMMRYQVSIQHTGSDQCDSYAQADSGFGPGMYLPGSAPSVPVHFRCRCFYASVAPSGVRP